MSELKIQHCKKCNEVISVDALFCKRCGKQTVRNTLQTPIIIVSSLLCISFLFNAFLIYWLYKESNYWQEHYRETTSILNKQIDARNKIIDEKVGTNLSNPMSKALNYNRKSSGFNLISEDESKKIKIPLYTPDGHYFGLISFAAYSAITSDSLDEYKHINTDERDILFSYKNYIDLEPGLSITQYN